MRQINNNNNNNNNTNNNNKHTNEHQLTITFDSFRKL